MKMAGLTSKASKNSSDRTTEIHEDVVEVGILLPANRAADLIQMARSRRESVGQMIRKLIDRELATAR